MQGGRGAKRLPTTVGIHSPTRWDEISEGCCADVGLVYAAEASCSKMEAAHPEASGAENRQTTRSMKMLSFSRRSLRYYCELAALHFAP